ncbi:enoyl-(Acyl carrier protein) reductase domain-containing protein [Ditylenchus destructor]|nr:enoyl-(Acyl carrier protein) reductase domain-containing protein [Ditylenchus destructor]
MKRANWGRIVFISSESALHIPTEMIHYGVSKTALLAVSRGLAESVAGTGITVNSVLPGPTKSRGVGDFVEDMARASDKPFEQVEAEFFEHVRPTSLIKRFASPQEVASLVAYVASPLASATTAPPCEWTGRGQERVLKRVLISCCSRCRRRRASVDVRRRPLNPHPAARPAPRAGSLSAAQAAIDRLQPRPAGHVDLEAPRALNLGAPGRRQPK